MKKIKILVCVSILTFTISCGQQKKYVQYKVKQGETMRMIAQNLDIKTKDLLRLNPDIGRRPEANTVIVIPNKKMARPSSGNAQKEIVNNNDDGEEINTNEQKEIEEIEDIEALKRKFIIHKVKSKETIYGLTRFYNVLEEDLLRLNPILSEGLKIDQIIKIKAIKEGAFVEHLIYEDFVDENSSLKIALMLPFKTKEYDSVLPKDIFLKNKLANIVSDFYLGAEIAIDSLKAQGVSITLNVYDTEGKKNKIRSIISKNNLNSNDVIIGPLYSEIAEIVANNVEIPVIFPLYSKNQSKFVSSKLIKTSPEKKEFRDALARYVKDNFVNGTITVVGDGKSNSNYDSFQVKKMIEAHDSISAIHLLTPKKGYIKKNRFLNILKPNKENWVILATDDAVTIADAINSLISLPGNTVVKVFAFDKGRAFEDIDNFKLAKIGFTYVSDQYIDETAYATKVFNQQYASKNKALPSFYATKGFDITYDVLMRLASGENLESTFDKGISYRVESKFDYRKERFMSPENKGLFIVQYNEDLSLTRLK